MHDGFVYLWSINPKSGSCRLQFSNKVTSFVRTIAWMGSSVITVGTRHVKVWRPEHAMSSSPLKKRFDVENGLDRTPSSPVPRTLPGRNCLLGSLIDAVFTCVLAISDSKAILCTDKGDVCLLDDAGRSQRLDRIAQVDSSILCLTVNTTSNCLWMGGTKGKVWNIPLDLLIDSEMASDPVISLADPKPPSDSSSIPKVDTLAMGYLRSQIVTVGSDRGIRLRHATGTSIESTARTERQIPAHDSAVLGVSILHQPNNYDAEFFTWSVQGTVIFWLLNGTCKGKLAIPLDQPDNAEEGDQNELKVVRSNEPNEFFISGDKFGVLRVIDCASKKNMFQRAHSGDILDIAMTGRDGGDTLVASCGRDRTLQLFRKSGNIMSLQQTLNDHAASVCNVVFMNKGTTLLSSSSDRTIVVRSLAMGEAQEVAFILIRVITLKASPMALSVLPESTILVVSTIDRQIHKYDLSTGRLLQSFKAVDHTGSDSLVISSLSMHRIEKNSSRVPMLLGVSLTDKSISVYDYDSGSVLVKEYGQTVISDFAYVQQLKRHGDAERAVVSTGLDGTVMIWGLTVRPHALIGFQRKVEDDSVGAEPLGSHMPSSSHPLRRILSKSEIQDFQKSLESNDDAPTPSRSYSLSLTRNKSSRNTFASTLKAAIPIMPANPCPPSSSSAGGEISRKILQDHSSTPPPRKATTSMRSRRPSVNERHHRKSTSNSNDPHVAADQTCKSLRAFRRKIASSTEMLKQESAEELERELKLTIGVISDQKSKTQVAKDIVSGDLLDTYLAKMIDERLAAMTKSKDPAIAGAAVQETVLRPKTPGENSTT